MDFAKNDGPGSPAATPRKARGRPRGFNDSTEQNTIKSLDRAMTLLARLSELEGATLTGLADDLGESPSTLYRVLTTLQAHSIVETDDSDQTWHIGPGAFLIGSAFLRRTSLIDRSRPALRHLMRDSGETANLGILNEGQVLFVSQVETRAPIRAFFPPGTRSALHASGIGKVLMADMDDASLALLVAAGLPRYTENTLTEGDALIRDMEAIRARGYSLDDEERNEGMRCIAAPVRNAHDEVVAGLSLSGPTGRVTTARIPELASLVVAAAESVTRGLGGHPSATGQ